LAAPERQPSFRPPRRAALRGEDPRRARLPPARDGQRALPAARRKIDRAADAGGPRALPPGRAAARVQDALLRRHAEGGHAAPPADEPLCVQARAQIAIDAGRPLPREFTAWLATERRLPCILAAFIDGERTRFPDPHAAYAAVPPPYPPGPEAIHPSPSATRRPAGGGIKDIGTTGHG
jgi:hypothetical protein